MQLVLSRGSPQSPWPHAGRITPRLLSQPEGELKATSAALGDSSWFLGRKEGRKEERCPIGGGDAGTEGWGPTSPGPFACWVRPARQQESPSLLSPFLLLSNKEL